MEKLDGDTIKGLSLFLLLNLAACISLVILDNADRNLCKNTSDTARSHLSSNDPINTKSCLYYGGRILHERAIDQY